MKIINLVNNWNFLLNQLNAISKWDILLNLVHTGSLQFLAFFHNLAANEHVFLTKTSKISINTPI